MELRKTIFPSVWLFLVSALGQALACTHQPALTSFHCDGKCATGILNARAFAKHSTSFRQVAEKAWRATHNGDADFEAGFSIDQQGHAGKVQLSIFETVGRATHLNINAGPESLGTLHVHNRFGNSIPSPEDVESARKWKMIVFVESRTGLYAVNPDGKICQLYTEPDWFSQRSVH